jgi:hypothetical protein
MRRTAVLLVCYINLRLRFIGSDRRARALKIRQCRNMLKGGLGQVMNVIDRSFALTQTSVKHSMVNCGRLNCYIRNDASHYHELLEAVSEIMLRLIGHHHDQQR